MHHSEVIYQIYPASFNDSNGDGHGDIAGITEKLDYIKSLNANAIWISPFFLSPEGKRGDGGYAITDYKKIGPKFGKPGATQEELQHDFDVLIKEAHKRHMRVYSDFVLCHTADDHDWFQKSRDPQNPEFEKYKDFYVWHPGKRDEQGNLHAPNNWKSVFGDGSESAWTFDEKRGEYYLHHFADSQPALNHNNPEVRKAICEEARFWFKKGVDGLRLDALPYANYDPLFRDNPVRTDCKNPPPDASRWEWQRHDYDMCQNAVNEDGTPAQNNTTLLVQELRKVAEECSKDKHGLPIRPKRLLGEVIAGRQGGTGSMEEAANYIKDGGLHSCYTDSLLQFSRYTDMQDVGDDRGLGFHRLKKMLKDSIRISPDGRLGNSFSNHDFVMAASRMTDGVPVGLQGNVIRQLLMLGAALPGDWYIYQGEELGKRQDEVDPAKTKDLLTGKQNRDGARTPMMWGSSHIATPPDQQTPQEKALVASAGFTTSDTPYLPTSEQNRARAVDLQDKEEGSILNYTRSLVKMRRDNPALVTGTTRVLDTPEPILAFVRESGNQTTLLAFNMGRDPMMLKGSDLHLDDETLSKLHIRPDSDIFIKAYGQTSRGLNSLDKNLANGRSQAATANGKNGHKETRIFALDLLLANQSLPDAAGAAIAQEHSLQPGQRRMIDKGFHDYLCTQGESEPTLGGSTAVTLATLKKLRPKDVEVNLIGVCGNDPQGRKIKEGLKAAGVNQLTESWSEGVETAVSHLIRNASGRFSHLVYPGTEADGLREMLARSPEDVIDKAVAHSDIVYMPGSLIQKFGVTLTSKLLTSRWEHGKQLVLALPTHARFGDDDVNLYRGLVESSNVVMGSDEEFCRIYGINAARPDITDKQLDEVKDKIQASFRERVLQSNGIKCPAEQVAFITRGNKAAWLITENSVKKIPVANKISNDHNPLGAGDAAFAGFLAGYVKGLSHDQSANIALGLAAEKVKQENEQQYLTDPAESLKRAFLRGHMTKAQRAYQQSDIPETADLSHPLIKPRSPDSSITLH